MLKTASVPSDRIKIDRSEVLRYLGCGKNIPDSQTLNMIEGCISEIRDRLFCKACFDRFPVTRTEDGGLDLGFTVTNSKKLSKNLENCGEIILFAATAGIEVDRIIQRYSLISPACASAAQAAGTAAIEEWCDILCADFEREEAKHGKHLRPRFSPGYGDFPLETQREIIAYLDCGRKIGVTLTDSLLMLPSKSVSAVVGVTEEGH